MPKKFIKRFLPDHEKVRSHKHLRLFGELLHEPNLWHLNRRSVAGAFAVGLFMAFMPVPFQMLWSAAAAILVRVNLPISVSLVWITNPITIPPVFFFAYKLGAFVLGIETKHQHFKLSVDWIMAEMGEIWKPLLLGSLILGSVSAVLGYVAIRGIWRWHVVRQISERRRRRAKIPGKAPAE